MSHFPLTLPSLSLTQLPHFIVANIILFNVVIVVTLLEDEFLCNIVREQALHERRIQRVFARSLSLPPPLFILTSRSFISSPSPPASRISSA